MTMIISSLGRCGSTLLFENLDKFVFKSFLRDIKYTPNEAIIKTHDYPPNNLPYYCKCIFLFGNPYDIVTTSYKKIITQEEGEQHFLNFHVDSSKEYQEQILNKDVLQLEKLFDAWYQKQNYPLLTLRYETMWDHIDDIRKYVDDSTFDLPPKRERKVYKECENMDVESMKQTYLSLYNKIQNAEDFKIW